MPRPPRLLSLSYRFPPETYPLAMRVKYVLEHLSETWDVDALTAAHPAAADGVRVHHVPPREPVRLLKWLRRLRLQKLIDLFVWPDSFLFWIVPALLRARTLVRTRRPDALVTFAMPYSTAIGGVLLKKWTGLPLLLNLNDSPTCSDMTPSHPTRLHAWAAEALEDWFVRNADAVIYVSRRNMERVRARQPAEQRHKFHLIRRGVRPLPPPPPTEDVPEPLFRIVYVGGFSGWHHGTDASSPSLLKRLYDRWQAWGRHVTTSLDYQTHSPLFVGRAVQAVLDAHPEWAGRIQVDVYGPLPPENTVQRVLQEHGLENIVHPHGPVPHDQALRTMQTADLLFMTLPDRPDGTPGGRISAKTYEYLMTDRPILAALPPGENREYLADKPGVFRVSPTDEDAMADVISTLATRAFAGAPLSVDRTALRPRLNSTARAQAFASVLRPLVEQQVGSTPTAETSLVDA